MKYIRTKDGRIVAIPNKSNFILYDDDKLVIDTTKKGQACIYGIVNKQANTIEELCDEFVIDSEIYGHIYWTLGLEVFKRLKTKDNFYGAIWTDRGLIYVAKMNEKGELELL